MDVGGQHGGARSKFDDYREVPLWNIECRHQLFTNILAERDAAIEGRNRAWLEKERALAEREMAVSQRNLAIKERDDAVMERNKAIHALHNSMRQPLSAGLQLDVNRQQADHPYGARELQILNALCDEFSSCKTTKDSKGCMWKRKREKPTSESDHLQVNNNWDGQNLGLNRVDYNASIMPPPVCSCTGIPRQCYKWGNGGWQSSCCTKTMSVYPLPVVPNKRYARVGGRKMTGSAFSKLLSRLASEGFDYSMPVDLKDHWSKHGTNRYITIK